MLTDVAPGTIGFVQIEGLLGWVIRILQALTGDASRYTHTFIVLDDGTVMEAMPSGARIRPLAHYAGRKHLGFLRIPITDAEGTRIVVAARALEHRGYGFLDYFALALLAVHIRPRLLRDFVRRSDRLICSQLCDLAYETAGLHLFADGRLNQDVTPGDLANLAVEVDWADWRARMDLAA